MTKTILATVSAAAIFAGASFALADTVEPRAADESPAMQTETTTDDLGVQQETGAATATQPAPAAVSMATLRPLDGDTEGVTLDDGVPADYVVGGYLLNPEGERIADVTDVLVDESREPQAVLASFGGFLGFMTKEVAIPLDRVQFARGDDAEFPTDVTEEEIEAMPEYEEPDA